MLSTSISQISKSKNKTCRAQAKDLLNPSKEARMISPGKRLKNFCPTLELTIELVKNPDTLTTPERIPVATFSDLLVNFLTLKFANTLMDVSLVLLHTKNRVVLVSKFDN